MQEAIVAVAVVSVAVQAVSSAVRLGWEWLDRREEKRRKDTPGSGWVPRYPD